MDKIVTGLVNRVADIARGLPERSGTTVLAKIQERYTRYGRSEDVKIGQPEMLRGVDADFSKGANVWFDDYLSRLHLEPFKNGSHAEFVQFSFEGRGAGVIDVYFQSSHEHFLITQDTFESEATATFLGAPICISELPADGNLKLRIQTPNGELTVSELKWLGTTTTGKLNGGVKLVLIRTFGNRNIVLNNLSNISAYLADTGENLDDYLFLLYDATGRPEAPMQDMISNLNIYEMLGGNYGGGGNASFLCALALQAADQLPEGTISECILWDDDASIEPEFLLRHRGFVDLRKPGVAHTAMIMSKQYPSMVQEYGGIWGGFFAETTHQVSLSIDDNRRTFPYLVRHGRTLEKDGVYLSGNQTIEFGTFIFLSFPLDLLRETGGPMPFFLRNDDLDFCLRIKQCGGSLISNQNLLSWHETSYNFLGEFFATLHGWVVNGAYFDFSLGEFLSAILERLQACYGVGNYPLMQAYKLALYLFQQGPAWFQSADIFKHYLQAMGDIRAASGTLRQVPFEVFETLDYSGGVEVHDLYDGASRRQDMQKQVVFIDKANGRYYRIHTDKSAMEDLYRDCVGIANAVGQDYAALQGAWKETIRGFSLQDFWSQFAQQHAGFVSQVQPSPGAGQHLRMEATSPWKAAREFKRAGQRPRRARSEASTVVAMTTHTRGGELPVDFDPERYLRLNPDVKNAGVDPVQHYLAQGMHENRKYR